MRLAPSVHPTRATPRHGSELGARCSYSDQAGMDRTEKEKKRKKRRRQRVRRPDTARRRLDLAPRCRHIKVARPAHDGCKRQKTVISGEMTLLAGRLPVAAGCRRASLDTPGNTPRRLLPLSDRSVYIVIQRRRAGVEEGAAAWGKAPPRQSLISECAITEHLGDFSTSTNLVAPHL